jgi:hypothetical protein
MKKNLNENEKQFTLGSPYTHGKDIKLLLSQEIIEKWVSTASIKLIQLADNKILSIIDTNGPQIRSAFYAIEDSQYVIEDYKKNEYMTTKKSYLNLYGLLQGLFVQQDAFKTLFKLCINEKFDLLSISALQEIREIRNNTVGHPTNNKNEYYLIIQTSLNKYGYTLLGHLKDGTTKSQNVSIYELLQKQENEIFKLMHQFISLLPVVLK